MHSSYCRPPLLSLEICFHWSLINLCLTVLQCLAKLEGILFTGGMADTGSATALGICLTGVYMILMTA